MHYKISYEYPIYFALFYVQYAGITGNLFFSGNIFTFSFVYLLTLYAVIPFNLFCTPFFLYIYICFYLFIYS
ncbi:hypothetical protein CLU79DRAFT_768913 [Phycomyces nitens]|nr:hypothetical protein CLU79DRAFT_768913 [Phycomyces nitens]